MMAKKTSPFAYPAVVTVGDANVLICMRERVGGIDYAAITGMSWSAALCMQPKLWCAALFYLTLHPPPSPFNAGWTLSLCNMTWFRSKTKKSSEKVSERVLENASEGEEEPPKGKQFTMAIRRQDVANSLDLMIQTIEAINNLIPIEIDQNILNSILRIRSLLENTLENENDFKDLIRKCQDICNTMTQGTIGLTPDQMSDALRDALWSIKSSIDNLHSRVHGAMRPRFARKLFTPAYEEKQITRWSGILATILLSFTPTLSNRPRCRSLPAFASITSTI
ncbi:hypothetical protein JVU11DRAFT_8596 [Chiua virens]|nr:hypothetical protein JVU11DRAFT_8596 [Chiua virens]